MKFLTLTLLSLIAVLQYQLWYGKSNWTTVWHLEDQVKIERQVNRDLQSRNTILEAEVNDLKQGFDAIEERARSELGMVKHDEIYFQVLTNKPDNVIDVNDLNKLLR